MNTKTQKMFSINDLHSIPSFFPTSSETLLEEDIVSLEEVLLENGAIEDSARIRLPLDSDNDCACE